jgi:acetyl esterase/lipase
MNLIQYASKKERVHVEQIIREQPVLKDADNVTIKTISVRKSLGLTMDVFAPAAVSDEPLPVLVDIHGGGLIAGRKEQNRNFCIRMAQNGYLVFAPDYRLVPETNIFGQISDVLEALCHRRPRLGIRWRCAELVRRGRQCRCFLGIYGGRCDA